MRRLALLLLILIGFCPCMRATTATAAVNDCNKVARDTDSLFNEDDRKVYLDKNNGLLTQEMFRGGEYNKKTKSIFVIQYDYRLKEDIALPEGCILEFDGGSISGAHTLSGNNTVIQAGLIKIFNTDVSFNGTWNVKETYPEWFGAEGDNVNIDNTSSLNACTHSYLSHRVVFSKLYYISRPIYCCHGTLFTGTGKHCGIVAKKNFHPINVDVKGESREVNALFYTPNPYFDPHFEHLTLDGNYVSETVCETFGFSAHFRYDDCYVQRFYGVGIYLAFSDNAYVRNTYVRYCNIGIGLGDNRINNDNPWDRSGEYRGKTNHVILDNNNVQFCNIGVFALGGADLTMVNHLSGHNALWAFYCKDLYNVFLDEFYSEDDFCCNFFVEKGLNADPSLNRDKTFNKNLYSFFNKSPKQRALMFLGGNCSYVLNTLQLGLYNLRLYEGCNTNLIENDSQSGIDAIIHAESGLLGGITVNGKWVINTYYKVNNKAKYNKYDICCNMRYNVTPNITSLSSLKVLNYNLVRGSSTIDRTPIIDRTSTFTINSSQNIAISSGDNNYYYTYKGTEGHRVNDGNYTFVKNVGGVDFYARGLYSNQVNSIRIDPSMLDDNCTYAAIVHYYTEEAMKGSCGIDFRVKYAGRDGDEYRPCYYIPELKAKQLLTCIIYFTKEDFIKNGKLAQYLYFAERESNDSLLSSPISIWKVGAKDTPVSLSFKESGNCKSRPTPYEGEEIGLVYFDTTLGKPIYWSGNKTIGDNGWVDMNGNYPRK